jgi:hypothetical protein
MDVELSNHEQFQSTIDLGEISAYWIQAANNGIQQWDLVTPTGCEAWSRMDLTQDHA